MARPPRPPRPGGHGRSGHAGRPAPRGDAGRVSRPGQAAGARGLGGEQIEGRRAVRELLAAGRRRVRDVWVSDSIDESPLVTEILALADQRRVPVQVVPRARLDAAARTDAPQGVLARAASLAEVDLDALATRPSPFLVCLDGITDPHNLGALLRSAECAGATGAVLPRHRAVHVTPAVAKAAAGAVEYVPLAVVAGIPAALARLRELGVWTVGLDAGGGQSLFTLDLATEPVALVLGAEGSGLSRLTRQRCDVVVSIPQHGHIGSLNVAAAGALACFEVARRRSP